jgi:hypothetical protein
MLGRNKDISIGLMFDDTKNLMLCEACEKTGLPVMSRTDRK